MRGLARGLFLPTAGSGTNVLDGTEGFQGTRLREASKFRVWSPGASMSLFLLIFDLPMNIMKTSSSSFAKKCGAASHLSKLCSSRRSAMKSTQRVPTRLRPCTCFRSREKNRGPILQCGLLFQPLSQWVHVTFFIFVHVEVRVGHVCCVNV